MKIDLKQRWLEGLRSGRYAQGTISLKNKDDKYCCLGVLCDLIDPNGWSLMKDRDNCYYWLGNWARPPSSVLPNEIQDVLIEMNDVFNKTFLEIADYVEQHVPVDEPKVAVTQKVLA